MINTAKPKIRISNDNRSCNCCGAQNYQGRYDSKNTRYVDSIYEIVVDHMVSAVCPDCLRSLGNKIVLLLDMHLSSPEDTDAIIIHVRDCNGRRDTLKFASCDQVLHWAENDMTEDDEILVITQGNICLYSGLQADPTQALTCDDITGFFA